MTLNIFWHITIKKAHTSQIMLIKQLARGAYGASGNPDFPSSGKSKAKCVPCCESALPP